ncbi:hypothetical protein LN42_00455 [Marinitoga sp. 1137]|uniref:YccF domain-containing protein n=1 Tax=Marinitoga sp. 1137 TaxID=1545835 RepID=UPI0009508D51|nr:YccF domain-containing protein [Marinitoga sp. 1137]APT75037.1 hypothetical protein LN42_00455 [Marinitoga sp. 1137]
MTSLFNIIWFIIFGWETALLWIILGAIFSITIIGIPIGKACFNLAKLTAFPYGKEIIRETELKGKDNISTVRRLGGTIANILWFPFGLLFAALYVILSVIAFFTIIGIPIGVVYIKLAKFSLFPIGAKVVDSKDVIAVKVANKLEERIK